MGRKADVSRGGSVSGLERTDGIFVLFGMRCFARGRLLFGTPPPPPFPFFVMCHLDDTSKLFFEVVY